MYFQAQYLANVVIAVGNEFNRSSGSGLDESLFKTCGSYPGQVPSAATVTITCNERVTGRYVAVLLKDDTTTILTLCEFEVYGRGKRYYVCFVLGFCISYFFS